MHDASRFLGQLRARIRERLDAIEADLDVLRQRGEHLRALPDARRQIASLRAWQLDVQRLLLSKTRDGIEATPPPDTLEQARDLVDISLDQAVASASRTLKRRLEDRQPGHRLMRERLLGDAATLLSELCDRLPVGEQQGLACAPPRRILDKSTWQRSWSRLPTRGQDLLDVDLDKLAQLGGRLRILHPSEHSLSLEMALEDLPHHAGDPAWSPTLAGCTLVGSDWWLRLSDGSRAQHTQWGLDPAAVLPEDELPTE